MQIIITITRGKLEWLDSHQRKTDFQAKTVNRNKGYFVMAKGLIYPFNNLLLCINLYTFYNRMPNSIK